MKEQRTDGQASEGQGVSEDFAQRIMALPQGRGAARPTTWQQDTRHKRFNAHGCGG